MQVPWQIINAARQWLLQGRNDRGAGGHNSPGPKSLPGRRKVQTMSEAFFFNAVNLLPKDLRFEHGGVKIASCPGRNLTLLRPSTPGSGKPRIFILCGKKPE